MNPIASEVEQRVFVEICTICLLVLIKWFIRWVSSIWKRRSLSDRHISPLVVKTPIIDFNATHNNEKHKLLIKPITKNAVESISGVVSLAKISPIKRIEGSVVARVPITLNKANTRVIFR